MSYSDYEMKMKKIADIGNAVSILNWDKEVNLPSGSTRYRAQQIATLTSIVHEMFTDKKMGDLLDQLNEDESLSFDEKRNVKLTSIEYKKYIKFENEFVIKKSHAISNAFQAWQKAKKENDFKIFQEPLDHLIQLVREEAEIIGYDEHIYDALLDKYEPNLKVAQLDSLFPNLKNELKELLTEINSKQQIDNSFLFHKYDTEKQWDFGIDILKGIGYDMSMGRQDISSHPFTTSFSAEDVRVTTRIDEKDPMNMIMSCIHEGGHALYEQGLNPLNYGLPLGSYISLGMHESQSRLYENHVGRSKSFWKHYYPQFQSIFKENLKDISLDTFYKGINKVAPNLIRTEADELHYHMHVIIRYELEKGIISGDIKTSDLKEAWNEKYQEYLGVSAKDDASGVLQDIHWSHGSFGYFPTYSLGSLYAAQFYQQAEKEIPNLNDSISKGQTKELLLWLREKIHQHGKRYDADELCKIVTGENLNTSHFMKYAKEKFSEIYN